MMKFIQVIALITILALSGCGKDTKKITYEIKKEGTLTIDKVEDIIEKTFTRKNSLVESDSAVCANIDHPCSGSGGKINNPYRIGYHIIKISDSDTKKYGSFGLKGLISYDLCTVGKKQFFKNIKDYRDYKLLVDNDGYHLYLSVEKMKERGFIDSSLKSQGDVCLYVNAAYDRMSETEKYESNTLIYTEQEINEALKEYKALQ